MYDLIQNLNANKKEAGDMLAACWTSF